MKILVKGWVTKVYFKLRKCPTKKMLHSKKVGQIFVFFTATFRFSSLRDF